MASPTRQKELDFLAEVILRDSDGHRSHIIATRAAEAGLDHLEITTQSRHEKSLGIKSIHRIYTTEA